MTQAMSMAIDLDQDIIVTNMCVKFGEDWTNGFQELDRKQCVTTNVSIIY